MEDDKFNSIERNDDKNEEHEETHEEENGENRERWGNHMEFLLASIGLAVGTGNVWR